MSPVVGLVLYVIPPDGTVWLSEAELAVLPSPQAARPRDKTPAAPAVFRNSRREIGCQTVL